MAQDFGGAFNPNPGTDVGSWFFGGPNQVGFLGGGYYQSDPRNFTLPGQDFFYPLIQQGTAQNMGLTPITTQGQVPEGFRALGARASPMQTTRYQPSATAGPDFRVQQQGLASQLFGAIAGKGPSVAQEQLRQTTQNNVAKAYALAQSGRYNPAAARMAAQNAGAINQQAAGQAALLRAQEIQNAQNLLGGLLGGARGQDISGSLGYLGLGQQANIEQARLNLAQEQMRQQGFGQALGGAPGPKILNTAAGIAGSIAGIPGIGGALGGSNPMTNGTTAMQDFQVGNAISNPGFSYGGSVPGYAHGMDLASNDTVKAMLSPGEIVLPRSVTLAEDAPERAADFVRAIRKQKAKKAA